MKYYDNGSISEFLSKIKGLICVPVDAKSGKLQEKGYQLLEYGAKIFYKHPESKIVFKELTVPNFDKLKEMLINAVNLLPYKLVGWDIGVAEDGPVLIEGNSKYHSNVSDIAYGGFKRHPVYQEVLQKYVY